MIKDANTNVPGKGKLLHSVFSKGHLYEVYAGNGEDSFGYIGYQDGERSVAATRPDVCLRALSQKHQVGLPETGEVIDFTAERIRRITAA